MKKNLFLMEKRYRDNSRRTRCGFKEKGGYKKYLHFGEENVRTVFRLTGPTKYLVTLQQHLGSRAEQFSVSNGSECCSVARNLKKLFENYEKFWKKL